MSWNGTMTCTVTNQTGGTITNLSVLHQWKSSINVPNPNPIPSLAKEKSVSFPINVGAGGSDEWSLSFTDAQGRSWFRNGKQCDVEEDDLQSKSPVNLNLGSQGFSIEMPASSSCTDNLYEPG
jgi:hypothetical protein